MQPATRSALILYSFFIFGIGMATFWVYHAAVDVKRKKEERRIVSDPRAGDMVWIPTGSFTMGGIGDHAREDELPLHDVKLDGFWIDRTEVTNEQFETFVRETGYVTVAEKSRTSAGSSRWVAGVQGKIISFCFRPLASEPERAGIPAPWAPIDKADWRHPNGPDSNIAGKEKHPVVHVCHEDALAYCRWAEKRLPTESEWEYAARGGRVAETYAWGNILKPDGKWRANVWQGDPAHDDRGEDGFTGTARTGSFPPNGYGLNDVAGNVWEITADKYRPDAYLFIHRSSERDARHNPIGPPDSYDADDPADPQTPKHVIRGGSYLTSADDPAQLFRPSAREKVGVQVGRADVGFRCVKDSAR